MKTAVQWLKEQYIDRGETLPSGVFQEALEMEEQQMMQFAVWCRIHDNNYKNEIWTIQQLLEQYKTKDR